MHLIKERRFIKSKISALLIIFLVWLIADNILEFVFPLYLDQLQKSYLEIGIILSLASLSGVIFDMPFGSLSDKVSKKKLMLYGLFMLIITSISIFLLKGNISLALIFLAWGVAFQMWRVPFDAKFAAETKELNRSKSYGMYNEMKYIGFVLGPLIGGFLVMWFGFRGIYLTYSALVLIATLLIVIFIKETNQRSIVKGIENSITPKTFFSDFKFIVYFGFFGILLLFFSLLFTVWEEIMLAFGPLFYTDVLKISSGLGGILMACFSLPAVFLSCYFGRLADKTGKKRILITGLIVTGISLVAFSYTQALVPLFILALATSVGISLAIPALSGLMIDLSYKLPKGKVVGIWDFFFDAGYVIGPVLGGLLASSVGIRNTFMITGIAFILSCFLFLLVPKTENRIEQDLKETKPIKLKKR